MNLLKKLSSFFSTHKLSHLTPVYKRTFVPDTPYSLKLWTPALIILGYNLYMNEWQAKNIGFLFVLSTPIISNNFNSPHPTLLPQHPSPLIFEYDHGSI